MADGRQQQQERPQLRDQQTLKQTQIQTETQKQPQEPKEQLRNQNQKEIQTPPPNLPAAAAAPSSLQRRPSCASDWLPAAILPLPQTTTTTSSSSSSSTNTTTTSINNNNTKTEASSSDSKTAAAVAAASLLAQPPPPGPLHSHHIHQNTQNNPPDPFDFGRKPIPAVAVAVAPDARPSAFGAPALLLPSPSPHPQRPSLLSAAVSSATNSHGRLEPHTPPSLAHPLSVSLPAAVSPLGNPSAAINEKVVVRPEHISGDANHQDALLPNPPAQTRIRSYDGRLHTLPSPVPVPVPADVTHSNLISAHWTHDIIPHHAAPAPVPIPSTNRTSTMPSSSSATGTGVGGIGVAVGTGLSAQTTHTNTGFAFPLPPGAAAIAASASALATGNATNSTGAQSSSSPNMSKNAISIAFDLARDQSLVRPANGFPSQIGAMWQNRTHQQQQQHQYPSQNQHEHQQQCIITTTSVSSSQQSTLFATQTSPYHMSSYTAPGAPTEAILSSNNSAATSADARAVNVAAPASRLPSRPPPFGKNSRIPFTTAPSLDSSVLSQQLAYANSNAPMAETSGPQPSAFSLFRRVSNASTFSMSYMSLPPNEQLTSVSQAAASMPTTTTTTSAPGSSKRTDRVGVRLRKPHIHAHARTGSSDSNSAWSATHVSVRRKSHDPCSPVTTGSYSSVNPSPAASFLAFLAGSTSHTPTAPGSYHEGDEIGDYLLVRELGSGSFSRVFEATIIEEDGGRADSAVGQGRTDSDVRMADRSRATDIVTRDAAAAVPGAGPSTDRKRPRKRVAMKVVSKTASVENADGAQDPNRTDIRGRTGSLINLDSPSETGTPMGTPTSSSIPVSLLRTNMFSSDQFPHQTNTLVIDAEIDKETAVWSRLHHPHILEMTDLIDLDDATIIVCELARNGTLLSYIRRHGNPGLPEPVCQRMFYQLCSAVSYLHCSVGILHRDIKLENILLDDDYNVKLADFGLSEELLMPDAVVGEGECIDERRDSTGMSLATDSGGSAANDGDGCLTSAGSDYDSRRSSIGLLGRTFSTPSLSSVRRSSSVLGPIRLEIQRSDLHVSDMLPAPPSTYQPVVMSQQQQQQQPQFFSSSAQNLRSDRLGLRRESESVIMSSPLQQTPPAAIHLSLSRTRMSNAGQLGMSSHPSNEGAGCVAVGAAGGSAASAGRFAVGSLHYCAPEDLRRNSPTPVPYTHPRLVDPPTRPTLTPIRKTGSDMWALGCVLYAMLTGRLPFNDSFLPRLQLCIMNGKFDAVCIDRLLAQAGGGMLPSSGCVSAGGSIGTSGPSSGGLSPAGDGSSSGTGRSSGSLLHPPLPTAGLSAGSFMTMHSSSSSTSALAPSGTDSASFGAPPPQQPPPPPYTLARELVESLLRVEPDDRVRIEQVMEHPWVKAGAVISAEVVQSPANAVAMMAAASMRSSPMSAGASMA